MRINKELVWPALMLFASSINIAGSGAAISIGADKVNGRTHPFFYTAMAASFCHAIANLSKIIQVCREDKEEKALYVVPPTPSPSPTAAPPPRISYAEYEKSRTELTEILFR